MREFDKAAYAWCKALRQRSIEDLQVFKLGVYSVARDDGDGPQDATQAHIATLERQIRSARRADRRLRAGRYPKVLSADLTMC